MKKIYSFLLVVSFVSTALGAEYEKVKSLSIYDLTKESLSKTYTDSQGNILKFSVNDPTFINPPASPEPTFVYSATIDNPLQCIGENPTIAPSGTKYSSFIMVGHAAAKVEESPYILIEVAGDNRVLEVEILGYATSGGGNEAVQANLICAFSSGDDPKKDDDFLINFEYEEPMLAFNQTKCATENKRELTANTKFIKLIATDFFGFTGVSSYACKPQIHAINIYAKDTGTSLGEETIDALDIQLHGRNLQLSEVVDVVIYDIAGKVVARINNTDNAYLDLVNSGIYVIQAVNGKGEKATQKVVIK